jgi:hypothetical protein
MSKQKYPQASVTTSESGSKKKSRISKVRAEYSSFHLMAKRKRKKEEAEERQAEYDKLTTKQKLDQLGKTGSNRQRARLQALLDTKVVHSEPPHTFSKTKGEPSTNIKLTKSPMAIQC